MDSLIVRVFKQFSAQDRRQLGELVRCSYFNRRQEVVRLCDYLAMHAGRSTSKALQHERLFAAACPGMPYNYSQLRYIQSYLLDLVRQFLILQEGRRESADQIPLLLRALRRRGMDDLLEKTLSAQLAGIEQAAQRDARYHFQQYQLHQERLESTSLRERSARLNLQPLPDELTVYYVSEMLRHACLASTHEAVAGQAYRLGLLEAILEAVERDEMLRIPAVAVYYHAYQTLQHPEDSAPLEQLKVCLSEHSRRFSTDEQRGLYLLAINGCIRRMNAGKRAYIREAFDLYRSALQGGVLLENGIISGFNYKNIIRLAVALNEQAWAEQFLEQHRTALHPRERDNLYRYNLAYLRFQQHDYARAMPLLQQVELDDPLNNLDARRMLLRSYFELGEWEALESLLQSFSAYLRRQKNLGYHRTTNENLIVFTKKLLELNRADPKAVAALRDEIDATPDVAERAWLLEQTGV
ncbi:MAG: hypothetical protein DYG98_22585 [Haliscomenobacteraceae bacterium CHB4]|nr:hypothetical protein [Saprospiraceae bacterium]MCE7925848.1 hypothetical protein [Haliscomenobacteraceae bacterium CHB4]